VRKCFIQIERGRIAIRPYTEIAGWFVEGWSANSTLAMYPTRRFRGSGAPRPRPWQGFQQKVFFASSAPLREKGFIQIECGQVADLPLHGNDVVVYGGMRFPKRGFLSGLAVFAPLSMLLRMGLRLGER